MEEYVNMCEPNLKVSLAMFCFVDVFKILWASNSVDDMDYVTK